MNKAEAIKPIITGLQETMNKDIINTFNGVPISYLMCLLSYNSIAEMNTDIRAVMKVDKEIKGDLPIEPLDTEEKKRSFLSTGIKVEKM